MQQTATPANQTENHRKIAKRNSQQKQGANQHIHNKWQQTKPHPMTWVQHSSMACERISSLSSAHQPSRVSWSDSFDANLPTALSRHSTRERHGAIAA